MNKEGDVLKKPKYEYIVIRKNCKDCRNKRKIIRTWPRRQSILDWCPYCMKKVPIKEKKSEDVKADSRQD